MSGDTFCGGGRGFFSRDFEPKGEYDWHDLFDFSTCFEESIVTSAPCMFIVVAGLVRIASFYPLLLSPRPHLTSFMLHSHSLNLGTTEHPHSRSFPATTSL
jgi:hypothetical protein